MLKYSSLLALSNPLILCNKVFKCTEDFTLARRFINCKHPTIWVLLKALHRQQALTDNALVHIARGEQKPVTLIYHKNHLTPVHYVVSKICCFLNSVYLLRTNQNSNIIVLNYIVGGSIVGGSIVGGSIVVGSILGDQLSWGQLSGVNCRGVNCRGVNCRGVNCRGSIVGGQLSEGQLSPTLYNTLPAVKKVSDCPLTLSEPVPKKGLWKNQDRSTSV